jgi:transposase-like protein
MCTRDVQLHLREIHGIDVSPDMVGTVTDTVPR